MKLGRRPGTFTKFIDSFTEETLLKVECDDTGATLFSYHLYDDRGALVIDNDVPKSFPGGHELRAKNEEVLLLVPTEPDAHIQYRLYNSKGVLMTCSDGARTQIFGGMRIEGNRALGRPPATQAQT